MNSMGEGGIAPGITHLIVGLASAEGSLAAGALVELETMMANTQPANNGSYTIELKVFDMTAVNFTAADWAGTGEYYVVIWMSTGGNVYGTISVQQTPDLAAAANANFTGVNSVSVDVTTFSPLGGDEYEEGEGPVENGPPPGP
jgi:hypothetical protein